MEENRGFCPVVLVKDLNMAIGFETVKADIRCKSCGFTYSSDDDVECENCFNHELKDVNLKDFQCPNCFNTNYDVTLHGYLAFGECVPKESNNE